MGRARRASRTGFVQCHRGRRSVSRCDGERTPSAGTPPAVTCQPATALTGPLAEPTVPLTGAMTVRLQTHIVRCRPRPAPTNRPVARHQTCIGDHRSGKPTAQRRGPRASRENGTPCVAAAAAGTFTARIPDAQENSRGLLYGPVLCLKNIIPQFSDCMRSSVTKLTWHPNKEALFPLVSFIATDVFIVVY